MGTWELLGRFVFVQQLQAGPELTSLPCVPKEGDGHRATALRKSLCAELDH